MLKLNQEELDALRESLPEGGYKLIAERLQRVTPEAVRKVLSDPARYNSKVIDATIAVLKDLKEKVMVQKESVKELTS